MEGAKGDERRRRLRMVHDPRRGNRTPRDVLKHSDVTVTVSGFIC